jgi:voltage-gated potassium channel
VSAHRQSGSAETSATVPASINPYELYVLAISIISIVVLAADSLLSLKPGTHEVFAIADAGLCVLFFFDFIHNLYYAPDRRAYFVRSGWVELLSSIPTIGIFRLGRLARIARLVRLIRAMRSIRSIGQVLSRNKAKTAMSATGVVALSIMLFASIVILEFETAPESNIKDGGDAVWWAFATITTVGYGDKYPVTLEGRAVAALLMTVGVGLFGALSGLVASWLVHAEVEQETNEIAELTKQVAELNAYVRSGNQGPSLNNPAVGEPLVGSAAKPQRDET